MTTRRVFVIWVNSLFHESARMLLRHPNIIWVGDAKDFTTAHDAIMKFQPDTILFEKTKGGIPDGVLAMLDVQDWDMRIIELSLDDNEMSLYHREHQTIVKAGDLLQYVLG